jgi:hypothetical protein
MDEKPFWIIWSEYGTKPPKVKHYSEAAANMVAKDMAKKYPGDIFHVMRGERAFQQQVRLEHFITGCANWTRDTNDVLLRSMRKTQRLAERIFQELRQM